MARSYVKSRRADNQAETRQRIVEAAMALHEEVGPASTTISMIADRAGVQRHTVYAHFGDEPSLLSACSGLHLERHPIPAPESWADIQEPRQRVEAALSALYVWYAETEAMTMSVLRDLDRSQALRDVTAQRFGTPLAAIHQSLASGLDERAQAALGLALSFYTWRTLVRESGLSPENAVRLMTDTVLGVA
jgi:AcrR family transcriptional regulator